MLNAIFRRKPRLELAERPHQSLLLRLRTKLAEKLDPARRRLMASWSLSVLLHVLFGVTFALIIFSKPPGQDEGLWVVTSGLFDQPSGKMKEQAPEAELQVSLGAMTPTPVPQAKPEEIGQLPSPSLEATQLDLRIIGIGAGAAQSDSAMLGLGGQSVGPKSEFFGQRGRGRRVVYVIDRSGSMLNSFEYLRRELKRSIGKLSYQQRQEFHVIFFSSGPVIEKPPPKLVPAIHVYKRKAIEFLDLIVPEGQTDPVPAMKRAFELKPDLIYFLTDGEFDPVLVDYLARWNRDEKVKIYTVAFAFEGNSRLLKRIARENGGKYTMVDEHDLGGW